ncbi:RNA-binding domain-containing protein [Bacillus massiliigorillae]|uniref:RNA-binding domain-containing protein n=1 Tax=Bacillus massiliigorillae TaxID=1243664 RepID=UPI0003A7C5A6|nr:RNA-binding domain-containing protein [Bacillus massiliigorillae]
MFKETPTLELKREVTEGLKKEVIAFANTNGGKVLIGVEDDGTVIGLASAHRELERISSILRDSIKPDILVHTSAQIVTIQGKEIIEIEVTRGARRPYHLANKGMKPSGVFVRHGTSVSAASDEAIRQMIKESDGFDFENMRCLNQQLTFQEAKKVFEQQQLTFGDSQLRTLGVVNDEGYYTNVALLLSDQCEHSIKCARYNGDTKLEFKDRKEFTGSLLKQVNDAFEYIQMHNATSSYFNGLSRVEMTEYPAYAIREALINAAVHRDYSFSTSILIHLFDDRIEFVSVGGLVSGLTITDIELGISQSRNPKLANIFFRLKWIESYGTGLQRMKESYQDTGLLPSWEIGPNSFVVTLPKIDLDHPLEQDHDHASLLEWLSSQPTFTSKDVEHYLNKSKSSVRQLIQQLLEQKVIVKKGNGPSTRYEVRQ